MSGPLRSKQGCWTCRLRKKKCDEGRPHCSICISLSIPCYGFGPKPDWMDNSEEERAVANSLKEIVKHTSRHTATSHFSKQRDSIIRIAPKNLNDSVEKTTSSIGSSGQNDIIPPLGHGQSQEDAANILRDGSPDSPLPEHGDHLMTRSTFAISADESVLLMHFLDHVFPLQYPMYKPGILEGGRGWLLNLLLRTKSLYHAALALSAYHRRITVLAKISHPCQVAAFVQQEKHLEICIELFNQSAQNSCSSNELDIATSIIQLMFFEVLLHLKIPGSVLTTSEKLFTGHGNTWQAHLHAATNVYQKGHEKKLAHLGLAEKSRIYLCEDIPLSEYEPVIADEVVNFRFLGGTIIWLDIISSITAGTAPHLISFHFSAITYDSQTKLENIMGCKNWVMLQIGRIAALHEHKTQALQQGHFGCIEFEQIAGEISQEIQSRLNQAGLESFNISGLDSATIFNAMSDHPTLVTRIFAYMASVYLHLVTHGFQKLEVLGITIFEAMRVFQTPTLSHLLPALVSPLYVIGSVAKQGDQQFFRNVFLSPPLLNPLLKHREKILPVLEEIWTRRQTTPVFTWKDSLELANDILLL